MKALGNNQPSNMNSILNSRRSSALNNTASEISQDQGSLFHSSRAAANKGRMPKHQRQGTGFSKARFNSC